MTSMPHKLSIKVMTRLSIAVVPEYFSLYSTSKTPASFFAGSWRITASGICGCDDIYRDLLHSTECSLFFSKWKIYYCSISFNSIWSVSRQLYDWNIEINRFWIISSLSHSSIAVSSVHGGGGRVFFTRLQLFQLINVTNTLSFVIWLSVVQWNINFRRFGDASDAFAFNLLESGVLKWFSMLHELIDLDFFLHCQWSLHWTIFQFSKSLKIS